MHFLISTQELNQMIGKLLNVVPPKPSMPILSHFLMEVDRDMLTLTASDLSVGMRCQAPVKMLEAGSTTLPARRLSLLVRELTAPHLEVKMAQPDIVEITANTSQFKIHGTSSRGYPKLPEMEHAHEIRIPQQQLKEWLFKVSFAVAREDNRFVLTGALMQIGGGRVTFLATDGKRLARAGGAIQVDSAFQGSYVLPLKGVEELMKNLSEEGEASLRFTQDKMAVHLGATMMIFKLLAGEYPDVSRVIPTACETHVPLHREELMSLLRQISLFTNENNHSAKFTFSSGDLKLSAQGAGLGEGQVSMPVNYQGPDLSIAFNPSFFLDILRHSKREIVTLSLVDAYNPGIITEEEEERKDFLGRTALFLLMPMRLTET